MKTIVQLSLLAIIGCLTMSGTAIPESAMCQITHQDVRLRHWCSASSGSCNAQYPQEPVKFGTINYTCTGQTTISLSVPSSAFNVTSVSWSVAYKPSNVNVSVQNGGYLVYVSGLLQGQTMALNATVNTSNCGSVNMYNMSFNATCP